jgi:hypothetical protein
MVNTGKQSVLLAYWQFSDMMRGHELGTLLESQLCGILIVIQETWFSSYMYCLVGCI